jgi:hypothetical protein
MEGGVAKDLDEIVSIDEERKQTLEEIQQLMEIRGREPAQMEDDYYSKE